MNDSAAVHQGSTVVCPCRRSCGPRPRRVERGAASTRQADGSAMAHQAVSLQGLQAELDSLEGLCTVLLPPPVPQGYDVQDLCALAETEGKAGQEQFKAALKAAAKELKQRSTQGGPAACCVCGCQGTPTSNPDTLEHEEAALRFTALPSVSFTNRTVRVGRGGFACGSCRALQDPGRFLAFIAACAKEDSGKNSQQAARQSLAQELCLHFASVNKVPEHIQASPQGVAMWAKEIMCRVYALQVLASNVEGWVVLGPDSQPVTQATPGLAALLLRSLLTTKTKRKASKSGSVMNGGVKKRTRDTDAQPGAPTQEHKQHTETAPSKQRRRQEEGQANGHVGKGSQGGDAKQRQRVGEATEVMAGAQAARKKRPGQSSEQFQHQRVGVDRASRGDMQKAGKRGTVKA